MSFKQQSYAILASNEQDAMKYAASLGWQRGVLLLCQRADLYLLYGQQGLSFDIVPGTPVLPWHQELEKHLVGGRLVRQRAHTIQGGSEVSTEMASADVA